jgi:hypothetical protein
MLQLAQVGPEAEVLGRLLLLRGVMVIHTVGEVVDDIGNE